MSVRFHRSIGLLLSAIMLLVLPCCSSKDEVERKPVVIERPPLTEITFYFSNINGKTAIDPKILREIEKRTRDTLNVKLEFKDFSVDYLADEKTYFNKLDSNINDEGADVISVDYSKKEMVEMGYLLDLTELLPQYAPRLFASFTPEQLEACSYEGRIYQIPMLLSGSRRTCVLVRKEVVEKLNLADIKTLEDYEKFLEQVKQKLPMYYPISNAWGGLGLFKYIYGYVHVGGHMFYKMSDPDMTLIPEERTEAYAELIQMWKRWLDEGYMPRFPITMKEDYTNGRIASFVTSLDTAIEMMSTYGVADDFVVYPLHPEKPYPVTSMSGGGMALANTAEEPEKILKLLEWLMTDQENYDLLMYGIEGEDYLLKDGRLVYADGKSSRNWCGSEYFFNPKLMRLSENDPEIIRDYFSGKLDNNLRLVPHYGFRLDDSSIRELIVNRSRASSYEYILKYDEQPMSFDEYIERLKELEADKIRDEIQRQLDKWRQEKKE